MEDLREAVRYAVEHVYDGRIVIELHDKGRLQGKVSDLSLSGLSFEMELKAGETPAGISDNEEFFITLHINEVSILAGVEKIWSIVKETGTVRNYRAGLKFKILADGDRLKLNSAIDRIRESLQSAARKRPGI